MGQSTIGAETPETHLAKMLVGQLPIIGNIMSANDARKDLANDNILSSLWNIAKASGQIPGYIVMPIDFCLVEPLKAAHNWWQTFSDNVTDFTVKYTNGEDLDEYDYYLYHVTTHPFNP